MQTKTDIAINSVVSARNCEFMPVLIKPSTQYTPHCPHTGAANYNEDGSCFFLIPVSIRLIREISYKQAKAVAFVALVRAFEHATNKRQGYTVNQLHELTGIHANTIVERLRTLDSMGLLSYDEHGKILIHSIRSRHKGMNLCVRISLDNKALKKSEKEILSIRIVNKLRQINYYCNAITRLNKLKNAAPRRGQTEEYKKLRRWLRLHCNTDYENKGFVDRGWSYIKIAEYLGISIANAVKAVKYAITHGFIMKHTVSFFRKMLHPVEVEYTSCTFVNKGRLYTVAANRYEINAVGVISL